eukprot:jgi/Mesvir1/22503/Mv18534-RA.2
MAGSMPPQPWSAVSLYPPSSSEPRLPPHASPYPATTGKLDLLGQTVWSSQETNEAFHEFDLDKNGFIGASEIARTLASMGEVASEDEVDEMILMADLDGDGQVSHEEFMQLIFMLQRSLVCREDGSISTTRQMAGSAPGTTGKSPPTAQVLGQGGTGMAPPLGFAGGQPPTRPMAPLPEDAFMAELQELGINMDVRTGASKQKNGGAGDKGKPAAPTTPTSPAAGDDGVTEASSFVQDAHLRELAAFQKENELTYAALRKLFATYNQSDKDRSGMVDVKEFCNVLRVEKTPFVERLFALFDTDGSGTIDLREFFVGCAHVGPVARDDKARFAFKVFDLDGDGSIDSDELCKIVKATNMTPESHIKKKVRDEGGVAGTPRGHIKKKVRDEGGVTGTPRGHIKKKVRDEGGVTGTPRGHIKKKVRDEGGVTGTPRGHIKKKARDEGGVTGTPRGHIKKKVRDEGGVTGTPRGHIKKKVRDEGGVTGTPRGHIKKKVRDEYGVTGTPRGRVKKKVRGEGGVTGTPRGRMKKKVRDEGGVTGTPRGRMKKKVRDEGGVTGTPRGRMKKKVRGEGGVTGTPRGHIKKKVRRCWGS